MISTLVAASPIALAALGGVICLIALCATVVLVVVARTGLTAAKAEDVPAVVQSICRTLQAIRRSPRRR